MRLQGSSLGLPGPNPGPARPEAVHLSGLTSAVKTHHLLELCRELAQAEPSAQLSVHWLDDSSA